jgi:membrane protease YdiL (CAAX protease family)
MPLGLGVNYRSWPGALILAAMNVALLLALAWLLRGKASAKPAALCAMGLLVIPSVPLAASSVLGKAIVVFLTYALFVGFGEEILYRGYMQSRLNEVFGKPYLFFGVAWGWGTILACLLFGLTHVGFQRWILGVNAEVTLAWGFWTAFSGLAFAFVREKSGSIVAPALLHGLPQALSSAAMLLR